MTKKTQILLIDDVDGSEATQTINFGLDSVSYEIDLNDKHASQLRDALAQWVASARKTSSTPVRTATSRGNSGSKAEHRKRLAEIREWARATGRTVSDRGRIPQSIVDEFDAR